MRRPLDKHLSQDELDALGVLPPKADSYLSADGIRQAEHHLLGCADCSRKLFLLGQVSSPPTGLREPDPAGTDCPKDEDVDWFEVAGGLWPELKARQLIMHAAQCGHCGPLLRAALSVDADPTPDEEKFLSGLRKPSRPESTSVRVLRPRQAWQWRFARWAMPVAGLIVVVVLVRNRPGSPHGLSGQEFAVLAANTYRQQAQGMLALDVHAESQQQLNEWFKANSQLPVVLPSSSLPPSEEEPFRVRGARLLPVGASETAFYIAYEIKTSPVGLVVTPASVVTASGGTVADFKRVTFHYSMVQGSRVVTWSTHGLTYALVSREGNQTQQSCMVCHSAMRDHDFTHTPTPLHDGRVVQPFLQ